MKKEKSYKEYRGTLYAVGMVLVLWQVAYVGFNSFVVPPPIEVMVFTVMEIPTLIGHLISSGGRILAGLTLTVLVGVSLGVGMGTSKRMDQILTPIVYLFYPVPRIAFLPIFMILFGLGNSSKIILIFAISVFHMLLNIRDSIRSIPSNMFLSAEVLGLNKMQKIQYMVIPAILPTLCTSLKIVLGSSMAALFFAENYATKSGIGYYIMNGWIKADYVEMYSGIIAISMFGICFFKVIDRIQRRICRWL